MTQNSYWTNGSTINLPGFDAFDIFKGRLGDPSFPTNAQRMPQGGGYSGGGGAGGSGSLDNQPASADAPFALLGFNNGYGPNNGGVLPSPGGTDNLPWDMMQASYIPPQQQSVTPTVSASESGIGIPDNGNYTPQGYAPRSITPTVSTQEGDQLYQPSQSSSPSFDNSQWTGQIQTPTMGGYQLSQSDLASLMQAINLPQQDGGGFGSGLMDRLNSLGTSPDISAGNVGQAAINAGGFFSPLIPGLAGLLQGFNLYDAPDTTGNAAADLLGTPGMLQSGVANAANWIDRQFGGTYMPSSYIDPTPMGPNPDGTAYSAPQASPVPASPVAAPVAPADGWSAWYAGQADPYSQTGNFANTFMQGAGFGGAGYGYGDPNANQGGGGGGFGGGGGYDPNRQIADGKVQAPGYGG